MRHSSSTSSPLLVNIHASSEEASTKNVGHNSPICVAPAPVNIPSSFSAFSEVAHSAWPGYRETKNSSSDSVDDPKSSKSLTSPGFPFNPAFPFSPCPWSPFSDPGEAGKHSWTPTCLSHFTFELPSTTSFDVSSKPKLIRHRSRSDGETVFDICHDKRGHVVERHQILKKQVPDRYVAEQSYLTVVPSFHEPKSGYCKTYRPNWQVNIRHVHLPTVSAQNSISDPVGHLDNSFSCSDLCHIEDADNLPFVGAIQTEFNAQEQHLSEANQKYHRRIRSEADLRDFSCQSCGQKFEMHDRLAKHVASSHRDSKISAIPTAVNKRHKCKICQRSFGRSDMLTRHIRLHTGFKPYSCSVCGQEFSRSDHLTTHQRTHTGERPYTCPRCPYAASRRDMITRHLRTHMKVKMENIENPVSEGYKTVPYVSVIQLTGSVEKSSLTDEQMIKENVEDQSKGSANEQIEN